MKMSLMRVFVSNMPLEICKAVHKDFEIFDEKGVIGDSEIRRQVKEFFEEMEIYNQQGNVGYWMEYMAKEIWRRFAIQHLKD